MSAVLDRRPEPVAEVPWPGVTRDALMIRRCDRCEAFLAPGTAPCASCGSSDLSAVASTGLGAVQRWTVVDCARSGAGAEPMPCLLAVVALDDGPWICTWIEGETAVCTEREVRVRFDHSVSGERYPVFCRCGGDPSSVS
ncbi:Zn-ribbon domain-containing OB-fold protein [Rhodococcus sp. NPDC127528]|uniref:Zn-ribbon domain-containing OB-fold protein n=1 Tax=unclassified Rhodococcus (in: high G+C Gram-positive bacteria) TaxID=192944 RepID=UPI00362EB416